MPRFRRSHKAQASRHSRRAYRLEFVTRERRLESNILQDGTVSEDELDESLMATFPASDPPSLPPRARIGSPKRRSNH